MTHKIFNGPTPQVIGGNVFLPWTRMAIATVCRPMKVGVHVVSSDFNFTALAALPAVPNWGHPDQVTLNKSNQGGIGDWFGGNRTGFPIEGPWLVYRAVRADIPSQMGNSPAGDRFMRLTGLYDNVDVCEWAFDLAVRRPIYLPYPGSLEIIGNMPGTWEIATFNFELGNAEVASMIDSEVTLTVQVASQGDGSISSRKFNQIPFGAHSYTYRDSLVDATHFPISEIWVDGGGKVAAGPGGVPLNGIPHLNDFNNQSSQFYGRVGLANAAAMKQIASGANAVGELQFHLSIM